PLIEQREAFGAAAARGLGRHADLNIVGPPRRVLDFLPVIGAVRIVVVVRDDAERGGDALDWRLRVSARFSRPAAVGLGKRLLVLFDRPLHLGIAAEYARADLDAPAILLLVVRVIDRASDAIGLGDVSGGLVGLRCRAQALAELLGSLGIKCALEEQPG